MKKTKGGKSVITQIFRVFDLSVLLWMTALRWHKKDLLALIQFKHFHVSVPLSCVGSSC